MTDAASLTPMNVGDCHEPGGRSDRAAWRWLAPATIEEHRQVERAATNLACAMFDYQHNAGRRGSTLSKFPCDRWGRHGNVGVVAGGTFIVHSARRHGIGDEAIMHAYEHPIRVSQEDEGLTMLVGVDVSGRFIEVGWVEGDDGATVIVHAMPARLKYLR